MFFPEALLNSPMFGIGLTIIVYVFCELIVNRFELNIIPPFVLACPIIMGIIYFQSPHITYEQYAAGASAELLSLQSSALFPSSSAASCLAPANRFCFL